MREPALAAAGRADPADRLVGRVLGEYRIVRTVGRGGMGVVYEALHETVGQRVAIKVLSHRAVEDPKYDEHVERFRREAVAIGRLHHPGLVRIHDYHRRDDGLSYIVMEYLDGESVAARIARLREGGRRPPQGHVVELGRQLASALQAAHAAKIVHRDLKPENVMLIKDPAAKGGERAKVLDFGIAKFMGDSPSGSFTTQNVALGTPTYMAPEQCEGAQTMDDRIDVYALGVILYEVLAGRPPFVADSTAQLLIQQMTKKPPPLRGLAPQVDAELAALIHDMLVKDPRRRPSMAEVEGRLTALRPAGRSWLRQRAPLLAVVSGGAFLLGLGLALWLGRAADRERADGAAALRPAAAPASTVSPAAERPPAAAPAPAQAPDTAPVADRRTAERPTTHAGRPAAGPRPARTPGGARPTAAQQPVAPPPAAPARPQPRPIVVPPV